MIAAESFLPQVNGVTNSVLRVLEHFERRGVEAVVVAPGHRDGPDRYGETPVVRLRALPMPRYPEVQISVAATRRFLELIDQWQPDVLHLASPFVHGGYAAKAAQRAGIPSVAIFQTDVAGFARHYKLAPAEAMAWARIRSIHSRAAVTLAPSRACASNLADNGVDRVHVWPRGVDAERFSTRWRSDAVRARLAPGGERLIGYVGRLAAEKQVADLAVLAGIPNTRIVVVGDGPLRPQLQRSLPDAVFLGFQTGEALSTLVASLDVFVHPGGNETFCQAAQEALASAVPVVAIAAGGLLDLVAPSHNGWLYPPGDLAALRAQVTDLVGDEFKRQAMGTAAREGVLPRTWSSVGDALLAHYARVTAPVGSAAV